jgi:3-oxoacyl-[acyl-carrier protein] reductase
MASHDFSNKVVIVTGAARGIGRAIARGFAQSRANVWAVDLNPDVQSDAETYGAVGWRTDVSDREAVTAMVEGCNERFGPPDVLVNVAGITTPCLIQDMDIQGWQRNIDINLTSVFLCATTVLPYMLEIGRGSIISFSSVVAETGGKSSGHYAAAKAGIEGFSRSLAREVGPHGIRVNVVAPGMVDTAMLDLMDDAQKSALARRLPLPRLGRPEDLVGPVLFLASEDSSYITGHTLSVNGGLAMS